jgi:lysophospholipase L1-like esterase
MASESKELRRLQRHFITAAAALAPLSPLLYAQGQITRWKVGLLSDAAGEMSGMAGEGIDPAKLFVLGESTVAGLGAREHKYALAGQFAHFLSENLQRPVDWKVLGKNGVTARRTIDELIPRMPHESFNYILLGIGGNDVMKLSSPRKWRADMLELLGILREKNPDAVIFITNCPMIIASPVIPQPIKGLLWQLSKMHDANIREFVQELDRVFYFPQPSTLKFEGFFADGIHPSEQGYRDWAEAMVRYFADNHEW